MIFDPLQYYYSKFGLNQNRISNISLGDCYLAIMLDNGNIGIAATLKNEIDYKLSNIDDIDLTNFSHRLFLTAYYNALLNYNQSYEKKVDIFEELSFSKYQNLVMVGLFETLHKNLSASGVQVDVFDEGKIDSRTIPISNQKRIMQNADAAVITSTSIVNGSFMKLMQYLPKECSVFLLGPSGTLSTDIFVHYPNIRYVFGSIFDKNNYQLLEEIKAGAGTKDFLQYLHKVFIKNSL